MEINPNTARIKEGIQESVALKQAILSDDHLIDQVAQVTKICVQSFKQKGRVWFCGNGGSAADAQHLAAELSGRFYFDRPPLFAEALHVNSSFTTAVANDYSYDAVFERMIQAKGQTGDVLFAISTSGNSSNIVLAAKAAQELGVKVVGMTGRTGGKLKEYCNLLLNIPSTDTPRIQECHILLGHMICELVESALFQKEDNYPKLR